MKNINRINTVIFQRIKGAEWELGIGLEFTDGDSTLVDGEGNRIKGVWDCKDWSGLDIKTNLFEDFQQLHYKKIKPISEG